MTRIRVLVVLLCGILCVVGLVFGTVFTYASRTLFDAGRFSQRAAACLAEPRIARVVAAEVTDQIIAARRDLTGFRPVIIATVEYVVTSAPFRAVIRRTAKEGHAALISRSGQDLAFSVADLGVIVRNALSTYPAIAEKIPERMQLVLGSPDSWPTGKYLVRVLQVGERLRVRAVVWLSTGLVLGVCGFWLARRRDRFLLNVGLGLAITALVVGAVAYFGGDVAALAAGTPVGADLVRGLWPVFLGPLSVRMLVLAGIGLVLVAGVTSLLQRVDMGGVRRAIWRRLSSRPRRAGWGLSRALLFIAIGLLLVFRPAPLLVVATVLIGSMLFFGGVQELFMFLARGVDRAQEAVEAAVERRRRRWPSIVSVSALVVALAGAGAYWLSRDEGDAVAHAAIDACNGHPELCDRQLNQVCFAATHNSMAAADIPDWMFPNQERGIRRQLEDGVRALLVDVHYGVPAGDRIKTMIENEEAARAKYEQVLGKEGIDAAMRIRDRLVGAEDGKQDVYLGHGFCELGAELFVKVLEDIHDFLVANPNEVILIAVQDEGVAPADVQKCFAESGLEAFVYRGGVQPPWPTLRELIESDQRVLVFAENQAEGVAWYHRLFDVFQETPYRFLDPSEFSNAPGRGGKQGSLLLMNHWIETAPAPRPSNAEIVNSYDFLLKRARNCRRERGMLPNLIAVDFYGTGDLIDVVDAMNGFPRPGAAAKR